MKIKTGLRVYMARVGADVPKGRPLQVYRHRHGRTYGLTTWLGKEVFLLVASRAAIRPPLEFGADK